MRSTKFQLSENNQLCFEKMLSMKSLKTASWLCSMFILPMFFAGCAANKQAPPQRDLWGGRGINLSQAERYPNLHRYIDAVEEDKKVDALDEPVVSQVSYEQALPENNQDTVVRAQDSGYGPPVTLQDPNLQSDPYATQTRQYQGGPVLLPGQQPVPRTGSPNDPVPGYFQTAPGGNTYATPNFADIDVNLSEAQTGRITFGAAFNSDSGVVGQIIIDERHFDITRFPRNFGEILDGTAWRGAGQGFRLELVPGDEVQRYMVSFTEPYLLNSNVSFSASGYFYDRQFFDWDEQRLGGRLALGYRLTPFLSVNVGTRLEQVKLFDPRVGTSADLNAAIGDNDMYIGNVSLIHDTRDHPFMASDGAYLELSYQQAFGDFDYPRADLDYRRYFLVYERPDHSGRHTLSVGTKLGFTGSQTPIFENYFAGGFSTMRGYDFRGASPVQGGVRVGGEFQWLNTVEYTFPITADDMIKGVFFCDFGTVEQEIDLNADNFRVAPGFGFRIHMPVGGAGGAPLAFDFAFPVASADTDDEQVFSFYMGVLR